MFIKKLLLIFAYVGCLFMDTNAISMDKIKKSTSVLPTKSSPTVHIQHKLPLTAFYYKPSTSEHYSEYKNNLRKIDKKRKQKYRYSNTNYKSNFTINKIPNNIVNDIHNSFKNLVYNISNIKNRLVNIMNEETLNHKKELDNISFDMNNYNKTLNRLADKHQIYINKMVQIKTDMSILNISIINHYRQMIVDIKNFNKLKNLKPLFLKSLNGITVKTNHIKNLINNHINSNKIKIELNHMISSLESNTNNITEYISKQFLIYYKKNKDKLLLAKSIYENDEKKYLELIKLYNNTSFELYLNDVDYEKIKNIIFKLKKTYNELKLDDKLFNELIINIDILMNKKIKYINENITDNCAKYMLESHIENHLI